jgi:hypothetical protein
MQQLEPAVKAKAKVRTLPAQRSSTARVFREWSAPASAARREDAIAATAFGPCLLHCRALAASNISAMDGAERAAPH